jgi:DNA-binding NarL/FixJ family response regulator
LPVLVLSMYGEEQFAVRAIRAGASGYLNKESASDQLVSAIRKIAAGGVYVSAAVAEALLRNVRDGNTARKLPHEQLSDRELQVLQLIAGGSSVNDIAARLNLSPKTVSTHKARVLEKMNMSNQAELIRYAMAHGLADVPPPANE